MLMPLKTGDLTVILKLRVPDVLKQRAQARARLLKIGFLDYIRHCIESDLAQIDDRELAREIARSAPKPAKPEPNTDNDYVTTSFKTLPARRRRW
jgi:hypothetical protein